MKGYFTFSIVFVLVAFRIMDGSKRLAHKAIYFWIKAIYINTSNKASLVLQGFYVALVI